jgi:hypothetical protein
MAGPRAKAPKNKAESDSGRSRPRRVAPSAAQLSYLERGLTQPGGKLPLFDGAGREVAAETIRVCLARGWAEPWFANPIKPDWIVAKLTEEGYRLFGVEPPGAARDA